MSSTMNRIAIRTSKAINQALLCIGVVDRWPAVMRNKTNFSHNKFNARKK